MWPLCGPRNHRREPQGAALFISPRVRRASERIEAIMSSPAERVTVLPAALYGRTMKVFVRDLILPCRIGVYSHEKDGEQRVRINLELTCVEHPAINDEHHNVVCYAEVVADIRRLISEGHINLVETLAERIAAQCLEDHRILVAKVRVEKLDVMPEASAVGVEIERHRVNR